MAKIAVYLEEETVHVLEQLATAQGLSPAELLTEALSLYKASDEHPLPKGIGKYRSGRSDVSQRAEELLFSEPHESR